MASLIYLDTHAVVWLYSGMVERFPAAARNAIETSDLLVSSMALLELQYLSEIGRFNASVDMVLAALRGDLGLMVCDLPFPQVARCAQDQSWTRDPFDRRIVSQAALREAPLLTKDESIHEHYPLALWSEPLAV